MNQQKPESRAKGDGSTLDLHSVFSTIQGEGPFTGHRAVFVRLAGCNLQCPGCDTEYTEGRRQVDYVVLAAEVMKAAKGGSGELVVITGGEPLRQSIGEFVATLLDLQYKVQIESNGMFAPDETLAPMLAQQGASLHLVVSPKTAKIHPMTHKLAHTFKYVLDHRSVDPDDGLPVYALEHEAGGRVARPRPGALVYLNPMDAQDYWINKYNLRTVAQSCLKHGYIAGVQLHKLMELA